jgi:hypothetical protein
MAELAPVDHAALAPEVSIPAEVDKGRNSSLWADKPWLVAPNELSAPSDAFLGRVANKGRSLPISGFLGKAVGSVHQRLDVWKEMFEEGIYVWNIIEHGYKIPVQMTPIERATRYREKNNQSACLEMPFVREEVARLLEKGQIIKVDSPPCV